MSDDLMLEIGTAANLAGIETLEKSLDALKKMARQAAEEVSGVGSEAPDQPQQQSQPPSQESEGSPFEVPRDGDSITGRGGRDALAFWDQYQDRLVQTGAVMASSLALGSGVNRGVLRSLMSGFGAGGLAAGITMHGIMDSAEKADELGKRLESLNINKKLINDLTFVEKSLGGSTDDAINLIERLRSIRDAMEKGDFSATTQLNIDTKMQTEQFFRAEDDEELIKNLIDLISSLDDKTQQVAMRTLGLSTSNKLLAKGGLEAYSKLIAKSQELGDVFSEDLATASANLEDSVLELGTAFDNMLKPATIDGIKMFTGLTHKATKEVTDLNKALTMDTKSEQDSSYHNEITLLRTLNPFSDTSIADRLDSAMSVFGSKFEDQQNDIGRALSEIESTTVTNETVINHHDPMGAALSAQPAAQDNRTVINQTISPNIYIDSNAKFDQNQAADTQQQITQILRKAAEAVRVHN